MIWLSVSWMLAILCLDQFGWGHSQLVPLSEVQSLAQSYTVLIRAPIELSTQGFRVRAQLVDASTPDTFRDKLIILRVRDGLMPLRSGDVVKVWGRLQDFQDYLNPGRSSALRQKWREGLHYELIVDQVAAVAPVGTARGVWPWRPWEAWRYTLLKNLKRQFPESAILPALILGDYSRLDQTQQQTFRDSGLTHLLAISGQHVVLVAMLLYGLMRIVLAATPTLALYWPLQKWAWSVSLPLSALYVALAGAPISALRALIILIVWVYAALSERRFYASEVLALAAVLLLAWEPYSLFSISFQLSFLAVACLIWLGQFKKDHGLKAWIIRILKESTCITLLTAPLLLYYFQSVSWVGILSNLVAIPWVGFVLLPLGLLSTLLATLTTQLPTWFVHSVTWCEHSLQLWAQWTASWAWTTTVALRPLQLMLCYALLIPALFIQQRSWRWRSAWLVLLLIAFSTEAWVHEFRQRGVLRLTMLDVGQGDALLLRLPDGAHYLIDAGGFYIPEGKRKFPVRDLGQDILVPALRSLGVHKLEGLILSHPHPDHYEGFTTVLKEFPVKDFYSNGDTFPDDGFQRLQTALTQQKIQQHVVAAATPALQRAGVNLRWINPGDTSASDLNNRSLAFELRWQNFCALLTGDMETAAETQLIAAKQEPCTVLKVPHHGSKTSSSAAFLRAVQPQFALLSVGRRNPFGLPAAAVVERYQALGIPLWRTDEHGAVSVFSDGERIWVESENEPYRNSLTRLSDK